MVKPKKRIDDYQVLKKEPVQKVQMQVKDNVRTYVLSSCIC